MNGSPLETYLWPVVLALWTIHGLADLVARVRGKDVPHAR